jgi:hypothetical protein
MFQRGVLGTLGSVTLGSVFGGQAPSPVPVASGALPLATMQMQPMQMLLQQNMNQQNMQQIQQMQQQMQQPHNMQNMQQHMQQLQQRQIVQLQLLMGVGVPLPPPPAAATKATKADKRAATKRKHADEWTTFEGKPMQRKTQYQLVWRRNTKARAEAAAAAEQAAATAAEQAAAEAEAEALAEAAAAEQAAAAAKQAEHEHAERQIFLSQPRQPSTRDRAPSRTYEADDVRHAEDSHFWWMSRGQKPKRLVQGGALVDIDFEGPDLSGHDKPKISLQQLFEECRIDGEAAAAAAKAAGTAAAIKASSQAAAAAATPPAPPPPAQVPISAAAAAKERWQALMTYLDEHESEASFHDMEQAGIDYLRWEKQEKACAAGGSYMAVAGAAGIHTIGFKRAKGTHTSFFLPSFLPSFTHSLITHSPRSQQVGWIRR